MSRFAAFILAASLALPLGACGFEPLYAKREGQASVPEQLSQIRVALLKDRSGQILRNYLLDDLTPRGVPAYPDHVLEVDISEPRQDLTITRSDTISRYGYSVIANFRLLDTGGRRVFSGVATSTTSFEVTTSEFATIAAQWDARDRLMQEISGEIRNQLAVFFLQRASR